MQGSLSKPSLSRYETSINVIASIRQQDLAFGPIERMVTIFVTQSRVPSKLYQRDIILQFPIAVQRTSRPHSLSCHGLKTSSHDKTMDGTAACIRGNRDKTKLWQSRDRATI